MRSSGISRLSWALLSSLGLFLGLARGALCVWRAPDQDIAELFQATSYKTVFEDIDDDRRERIEAVLGQSLDPDETQFKFFPVFDGDEQVGTVMTHAGKGQFGVIEVVVAVFDTGTGAVVRGVKIQRDREKAKAALRSRAFLSQFKGMTAADDFTVGENLNPAAENAVKSSQAVAGAVRKLLVVYDEFYGPAPAGPDVEETGGQSE